MIFWDSSAIVPLLVAENATAQMLAFASRDPEMLVWWGSTMQCVSALARREREGLLDAPSMSAAIARLKTIADGWHEVEASEMLRQTAIRLLRVHPLRGADALQLAAALIGAGSRPDTLAMITLDDRLAEAARKEGFGVQA